MPEVYHCSNCSLQHERPVGKKCQFKDQGESLPTDVEVAASPSSDIRVSDQILLQLQQLGGKDGYDGQEGAADGSSTGTGQLKTWSDHS